ncbi:TetR/AcrR family transcriptional regulator [Spongiibacter sp. KMU-158]|uniref:TetR/AcrR family transcriptional regulator n=1 Tax=Spongiibacter pelagi TaxID=2760804 RepID=A0A927C2D8_9GAMM|nr:TetR family transcriptional regulator [Spongiibacter pelagi]MBD2858772.1 TetR/AcrR family transcriptional regulator [Spongiibacter pelagi]
MPATQLGRRERKKLAVRDNICRETVRLIERYGVEGVTIDAICDCVDIAKKTFYNYYATKGDLLNDILRSELLQRTEQLIDSVIESGRDFAGQLELILEVFSERDHDSSGLERELIAYSVGALSTNLNEGGQQLAVINGMFRKLFDFNAHELKPGLSPAFCSEMAVGMFNAITLNRLHDPDYNTDKRYAELLTFLKSSMLAKA